MFSQTVRVNPRLTVWLTAAPHTSLQDLGSTVGDCARVAGRCTHLVLRLHFPKVADQDLQLFARNPHVVQQTIRRLEVSVDEAVCVQVVQALGYVPEEGDDLLEGEPPGVEGWLRGLGLPSRFPPEPILQRLIRGWLLGAQYVVMEVTRIAVLEIGQVSDTSTTGKSRETVEIYLLQDECARYGWAKSLRNQLARSQGANKVSLLQTC